MNEVFSQVYFMIVYYLVNIILVPFPNFVPESLVELFDNNKMSAEVLHVLFPNWVVTLNWDTDGFYLTVGPQDQNYEPLYSPRDDFYESVQILRSTHSWWPLRRGVAVEVRAEGAECIWELDFSCTFAPQYLDSHCSPGGTQTHQILPDEPEKWWNYSSFALECLVCFTLMSLMSCRVGVSMGVLLSMTPCMAAVHLMASFSILV